MEAIPARIATERADVPEAVGKKAPLLVFPNYNDHDWAKVALDDRSLAFVRDRIEQIEDTLLRQMLWSSLYTMARDAQLKSTEYLDLVRRKMPLEPNVSMVDAVLLQAQAVLGKYVPDALREPEARAMFATARDALHRVPPGDLPII